MGNSPFVPRVRLELELSRLQLLQRVPLPLLRSLLGKIIILPGSSPTLLQLIEHGYSAYGNCLAGRSCEVELQLMGGALVRLGSKQIDDDQYTLAIEWAKSELVELMSSSVN